MPARVSTMRAGSLPARSSRVMDLVTNPPNFERSMKSAYSNAYPQVPEHVRTGLANFRPARLTARSGMSATSFNRFAPRLHTRGRRSGRLEMGRRLALMILLAIVVRAGGEPPATQPDAFEPRYRTVARWTGTIKMRIRSYATREPGLFGLALSAPNNLEESTAQVSIREEADEVDGARRTVVESLTWSSKVSDLYYQNKDGSRVAAGPGGGGGGSYSEAELAGDPAPPSSNQDEFVAEKRQQIDEATRALARLESELAQARERARAWAEQATPQERAAEQLAEAALQALLRAQTVDDNAAQSAAQDAYGQAEQARDELIRQRLGAAGDAFAREMEELAKVFQSGDQKRIAEAT